MFDRLEKKFDILDLAWNGFDWYKSNSFGQWHPLKDDYMCRWICQNKNKQSNQVNNEKWQPSPLYPLHRRSKKNCWACRHINWLKSSHFHFLYSVTAARLNCCHFFLELYQIPTNIQIDFKPITLKKETEEYTISWAKRRWKPFLLVPYTCKMFAANFNKCRHTLVIFPFVVFSWCSVAAFIVSVPHIPLLSCVIKSWMKMFVLNVILNFTRIEFPLYPQSHWIAWQWKWKQNGLDLFSSFVA